MELLKGILRRNIEHFLKKKKRIQEKWEISEMNNGHMFWEIEICY